jgi:hypothetical protein
MILAGGTEVMETAFLEWKTSFDLAQVRYRAACAKHILAFANRHPDRARRNVEGYGYLLLGLEPGSLVGVPEVWDPEQLERWISPYVGDAVFWDPHYVETGGKQVLLVAVDPPQWGDPIHPLRKESQDELGKQMRAGTIYIRRPGKSEQADGADIDMLTERSRAGGARLSISVELITPTVRALSEHAFSEEAREAELARWRTELLRDVPAEPERLSIGPYGLDIPMPNLDEPRSPQRFRTEVSRYIEACGRRWPSLVAVSAAEADFSPLQFLVRNETEHVYEQVQVEVYAPLERSWIALDGADARKRFAPPERPAAYGRHLTGMASRIVPPGAASRRTVEVEEQATGQGQSSSVLLRFEPLLVRPHSSHPLTQVQLMLPPALAEVEIPLSWRATSVSTAGEVRGRLPLPVAAN